MTKEFLKALKAIANKHGLKLEATECTYCGRGRHDDNADGSTHFIVTFSSAHTPHTGKTPHTR